VIQNGSVRAAWRSIAMEFMLACARMIMASSCLCPMATCVAFLVLGGTYGVRRPTPRFKCLTRTTPLSVWTIKALIWQRFGMTVSLYRQRRSLM